MMDPLIFSAFAKEMEKRALVERLVRLGFTDVPKTPRLLMRKRSPQELRGIQEGVDAAHKKYVMDPIMGVAEHGLKRLPAGPVQQKARAGAQMLAADPIGAMLPVTPVTAPLWYKGKSMAEKAIDKRFPLPGK